MKKRIVSMLLVAGMVLSGLVGCGQTEDQKEVDISKTTEQEEVSTTMESESEVSDGEIPLDYFAGTEITIALVNHSADLNMDKVAEKAGAKMISEATGIKINWIPVDAAAKNEKTATLLAGDMPDMLIGLVGESMITQNMDLFYDLSEEGLLDTYAPNVVDVKQLNELGISLKD